MIVIFLFSQVDEKDSELRELKSTLSKLKDQHEQAQSKVGFAYVIIPSAFY